MAGAFGSVPASKRRRFGRSGDGAEVARSDRLSCARSLLGGRSATVGRKPPAASMGLYLDTDAALIEAVARLTEHRLEGNAGLVRARAPARRRPLTQLA